MSFCDYRTVRTVKTIDAHAEGGPLRLVVRARLGVSDGGVRVESVSFVNVPAFVLHGGLAVKVGARRIRADVAFGGAFYAIVDSEAVGLPIDAAHLPELRRAGMEITHAVEAAHSAVHPLDARLRGRPFVHESLIAERSRAVSRREPQWTSTPPS